MASMLNFAARAFLVFLLVAGEENCTEDVALVQRSAVQTAPTLVERTQEEVVEQDVAMKDAAGLPCGGLCVAYLGTLAVGAPIGAGAIWHFADWNLDELPEDAQWKARVGLMGTPLEVFIVND